MSITVVNEKLTSIKVSINRWGTGGNTDYYKIKPNDKKDWDRTDDRGFVMFVEESSNNDGPWYIEPDSLLKFQEDGSTTCEGSVTKIEVTKCS